MIRLLVALDGSHLAEAALRHALSLARSFESELHLLTVIEPTREPSKPFDDFDWELRRVQTDSYLKALQRKLADQPIDLSCHIVEGHPPTEIIKFCERHEIDLMLLSAYGAGGITEFPCGGTVQKVIARAGLSAMVVRPEDSPSQAIEPVHYQRILVLLDGSRRSDWAVFLAAKLAQANDAELNLLQVYQEPKATPRVLANPQGKKLVEQLIEMNTLDAQRHMEELRAQLPRGVKLRSRVLVAPEVAPAVEEIAQTDNADLLILSAHGMFDSHYWLYGPVSETILAHTSRPVLVFEDSLRHSVSLTPVKGEPARRPKVETHRAEAG